MRQLLICLSFLIVLPFFSVSCKMAPKDEPGDTVAASVFNPVDTAALNRKARKHVTAVPVKDSTDIFYMGEGNAQRQLLLISYPSRRDTVHYVTTRHFKTTGNTEPGRAVRIKLWISDSGDTLVSRAEEFVAQ